MLDHDISNYKSYRIEDPSEDLEDLEEDLELDLAYGGPSDGEYSEGWFGYSSDEETLSAASSDQEDADGENFVHYQPPADFLPPSPETEELSQPPQGTGPLFLNPSAPEMETSDEVEFPPISGLVLEDPPVAVGEVEIDGPFYAFCGAHDLGVFFLAPMEQMEDVVTQRPTSGDS